MVKLLQEIVHALLAYAARIRHLIGKSSDLAEPLPSTERLLAESTSVPPRYRRAKGAPPESIRARLEAHDTHSLCTMANNLNACAARMGALWADLTKAWRRGAEGRGGALRTQSLRATAARSSSRSEA